MMRMFNLGLAISNGILALVLVFLGAYRASLVCFGAALFCALGATKP